MNEDIVNILKESAEPTSDNSTTPFDVYIHALLLDAGEEYTTV